MKKIAALLAALALLCAPALAFEGSGYPAWDGVTVPDNGLCGALGADRLSLSFDPSGDFSNVGEGLVQACFFAYDATEEHYLELYLLLPQTAAAGDVLTAASGASICLYETALSREDVYYAGATDAPEGSAGSIELTLEAVESGAAAITMRGRFTARLLRYNQEQPTGEALDVSEAYFSFTLPLNGAAVQPTPTQGFPTEPQATPTPGFPSAPGADFPGLPGATFPGFTDSPGLGDFAPAPAFTLPPDYAVI